MSNEVLNITTREVLIPGQQGQPFTIRTEVREDGTMIGVIQVERANFNFHLEGEIAKTLGDMFQNAGYDAEARASRHAAMMKAEAELKAAGQSGEAN